MNDGLRQLQQLLRIGTARAGSAPPALAAPLDALLPASDAATPQAGLWLGLAALDLWERSGFVPVDAAAVLPSAAAPAETLRPCPSKAEATLALLLHAAHSSALLAQWLRQLHDHDGRLPERFLPKLLDMATRQGALRPALLPVLGERGRWLAAQQADWSWAFSSDAHDGDTWDTGSFDQRIHVLRAWRARDPASARARLAAAWKSDPPEHRAALLAQLATGLGPADEGLLETALDDRRKEVRAAAQRLLASLPESQFSQRMRERLLPLFQLERPLLRAPRLHLTLPAGLDAAMQRDGIGAATHRGLGEKSGWVVDMLAAIDPDFWNLHFARTPQACLALALDGDSAGVLVRGWALAAVRRVQCDTGTLAWLHALARWWIGAESALRDAVPAELFETLAATLHLEMDDEADKAADSGLDALLDAFPRSWTTDAALVQLLQTLAERAPHTWPTATSRHVIRLLDDALPALKTQAQGWFLRQLLGSLALAIDPVSAIEAEPLCRDAETPDSTWRNAFAQFFDTVRLRHTITLSFQEPA